MSIRLEVSASQYLLLRRALANYLWCLEGGTAESEDTWMLTRSLDDQAVRCSEEDWSKIADILVDFPQNTTVEEYSGEEA